MNADLGIDDWHSVEKLLSDWYHQASINRDINAKRAEFNKQLHYWLGIPVVIFSSIVGSAAFTQINQTGNNKIRVIAGLLSIAAAVLAGLQTFLGFGGSAEKYRAVGIGYEQLANEIEKLQALPVNLRGGLSDRINSLENRLNALAQGSPDIPDHDHANHELDVN